MVNPIVDILESIMEITERHGPPNYEIELTSWSFAPDENIHFGLKRINGESLLFFSGTYFGDGKLRTYGNAQDAAEYLSSLHGSPVASEMKKKFARNCRKRFIDGLSRELGKMHERDERIALERLVRSY